jgi:hypothetical protein
MNATPPHAVQISQPSFEELAHALIGHMVIAAENLQQSGVTRGGGWGQGICLFFGKQLVENGLNLIVREQAFIQIIGVKIKNAFGSIDIFCTMLLN